MKPVKCVIALNRDPEKDNKLSYPPAVAKIKALPNNYRKSSYCSIMQTLLGKATVRYIPIGRTLAEKIVNCRRHISGFGPVGKPHLFELIRNCAPVPCIYFIKYVFVLDPGKGVCTDPVNGGTILGKGGPDPQGGNKERQLSPDKGRDKTL